MTIGVEPKAVSISTIRTLMTGPSPWPVSPSLSLSHLLSSRTLEGAGISVLVPQQILRTTSPRSAISIKCWEAMKSDISIMNTEEISTFKSRSENDLVHCTVWIITERGSVIEIKPYPRQSPFIEPRTSQSSELENSLIKQPIMTQQ
jgi:hypothetical protein